MHVANPWTVDRTPMDRPVDRCILIGFVPWTVWTPVDRPVDRSVDRCILIGFVPWTEIFIKK